LFSQKKKDYTSSRPIRYATQHILEILSLQLLHNSYFTTANGTVNGARAAKAGVLVRSLVGSYRRLQKWY